MDNKNIKIEEVKYSKDQLLSSRKYRFSQDILESILKDDKEYSFTEIDSLIEKFMKGKVR